MDKEIMLGVPNNDDDVETVELMNHRAIVEFPENTVEAQLHFKVFHNGELIRVGRTLSMDEVRTAFRKADDGYIDDDDVFTITEKGLKWLEENQTK